MWEGIKWGPWVVVAASMFMELAGGHVYLFGKYSDELKFTLFSDDSNAQTRIQGMALAANIGNYLPFAGPFYDSRWGGPTSCAIVGILFTFPGYLLLYMAADGMDTPYPVLLILCGMWGHGSSYYNSAAIATCVRNFPQHRGIVVGLLSSFFGLSASVMVQGYYAWFKPSDLEGDYSPAEIEVHDSEGAAIFLLFLAIATTAIAMVSAVFIRKTEPVRPSRDTTLRFRFCQIIVTLSALLVMINSIVFAVRDESPGKGSPFETATIYILLVLLISLMLVPCGSKNESSERSKYTEIEENSSPAEEIDDDEVTIANTRPEYTASEALRRVDFYLLFFSLIPIMGGGLTVTNNIAQIAKARGYENITDVLIQMMSVFNCFSRMATGALSDYLEGTVPRPFFLTGILVLMGLAHILLLLPYDAVILPGSSLAAFAYGSIWAIYPTLLSEMFGLQSFATLYTICVLAATIGSLSYSTFLSASIYESHQNDDGDCFGVQCYRVTHIVVAVSTAVGVVLSLVLYGRVRYLYKGGYPTDLCEDQRDVAEPEECSNILRLGETRTA
eukprot:TRINITY_DN3733_c2_g2_i1.p1 TRINITY_DN3733_c2_g2~~TRINITY_DN3733_c2_g2_i1.p1  ORF type:complete len:558 (+),score=77.99 TRINITY_DN3733_c2_g2_i1:335-2008(+)